MKLLPIIFLLTALPGISQVSEFNYKGERLRLITPKDTFPFYDSIRFNKTHDTAFIYRNPQNQIKEKNPPAIIFYGSNYVTVKFFLKGKQVFKFTCNNWFELVLDYPSSASYGKRGKKFNYDKASVTLR